MFDDQRGLRSGPLSAFFLVILVSSSNTQIVRANEITYTVIPVGNGDAKELAGGSITTDGTLGLLSPDNIVSMRVDLELNGFVVVGGEGPQVFDGATSLDLNNASLSIDGEISCNADRNLRCATSLGTRCI